MNLTPRELEVQDLICKGRTHKQIQQALSLSESTIKLHVSSIASKYGINSRFKLKAIIKKVTGKKYLRWRNDKQFLMDTATGASIKLSLIGNVDDYVIVDEKGEVVNELIKQKLLKKRHSKNYSPKNQVISGYYCDCEDSPDQLPTDVDQDQVCKFCGFFAVYKKLDK